MSRIKLWHHFYVFCSVKQLFVFLFLSVLSQAQVLNNSEGQAFTDKPFFNKTFIKGNKIKSIDGVFNYKRSGEAMYPTKYHYVYQFDEEGNLIASYETRTDDGTADTTWNKYEYDDKGRVAIHKRGDTKGLTSIHYFFDEKGRVIKEEFWKEPIDSLGVPEKQVLQNTETMSYDNYDLQEKKTVYNSYELPYIHIFSYFNEDGYLIEKEERLMMTSTVYKYKYAYNEKGLMDSIQVFKKNKEIPAEKWTFNYDEFGNLLEKNYYKDGVYITETEIIYNSKSNLMSAVLIRDVKTNFIMAIRFQDYQYYD